MNNNKVTTVVTKSTDQYQLNPQKRLPGIGKVKVTPKEKPQLVQSIESANWNCVENNITLEILETPGFSAFAWIYNINIVRRALQKSPFCDIDQDVLTLQFFDEEELQIAVIKLNGLELKNHQCLMDRNKDSRLIHTAVIAYDSLEMMEVGEAQAQDFNVMSDESWSKERIDRRPVDHNAFRDPSKLDEIEKTTASRKSS